MKCDRRAEKNLQLLLGLFLHDLKKNTMAVVEKKVIDMVVVNNRTM